MITGLNHLTIAVRDLETAFAFYKEVLGFQPLMRHAKGAYFLAGDLWFCLEFDPATRVEALPEYTHFAFSVAPADFQEMLDRISEAGAKIWKVNSSEGESIYFLDPDGHKLEIHVGSWKSRMAALRKNPWNDSVVFFAPPESSKNPLHGLTLEVILKDLVEVYGWEELGERIKIRCFTHQPSMSSSLKFLRKTEWARKKVEELYVRSQAKD